MFKKAFLLLFLFALTFCFAEYRVFDNANIIPPTEEQVLEKMIMGWEQDTKHQMAVVTVKSLNEQSIEEKAIKVFEKQGIGRKGIDDGVLFLIAPNERKVRIEVGYGLEQYLNDGLTGQILDNYVIPAFKQGDMVKGILYGTKAIIMYQAKAEGIDLHQASTNQLPQQSKPIGSTLADKIKGIFIAIIFIIILIRFPWLIPIILMSSMSGGRNSGGGFGSFGGGMGGFGGGGSGGGGGSRGW